MLIDLIDFIDFRLVDVEIYVFYVKSMVLLASFIHASSGRSLRNPCSPDGRQNHRDRYDRFDPVPTSAAGNRSGSIVSI